MFGLAGSLRLSNNHNLGRGCWRHPSSDLDDCPIRLSDFKDLEMDFCRGGTYRFRLLYGSSSGPRLDRFEIKWHSLDREYFHLNVGIRHSRQVKQARIQALFTCVWPQKQVKRGCRQGNSSAGAR